MTVKEELLALLLEEEGIESLEAAIPRAAEESDSPLSFAQRRLWFLDQMDPGNSMYNMPFALRLRGPLSVPALERTLTEIVRRHEALRSVFPAADGEPVQVVRAAGPQPLPRLDLRGGATREALAAAIEEEVHHAFDLAAGPLLRTSLLALDDDHHVLVANMHHVVSDGWSMGVFTRELVALYSAFAAGEASPLPPLPIQYADFASWQRDRLRGERLDRLLGYWRDALAGAPPRLELPADRPRPPRQSFRGDLHTFHLPRTLADALGDLSRREGVTLFMSLLAAFKTLLHRWSGEEHVVVASSIANRTRTEVEALIGFFVNMLPLHADLSGDPGFLDLLQDVRRVTLAGYDHQELPFDRLVEELEPERDLSYSPLCQVFFALQEPPPALELPGLTVELLDIGRTTARYDLYLDVHQTGDGGLEGRIEYATDLFEASTVERFARQYQTLLEGIVADPGQRLSRLPLLGEAELGEAGRASRGALGPAGDRSLAELFEEQVERRPGDTAAICGEASITYRELDRRANRLANRLRSSGGVPEVPVGVMLERSLDSLVALLAVLKTGGVYVPLDPDAPPAHRAFVLADAGAGLLVTSDALQARWPEDGRTAVVSVDDESLAAESDAGPSTPAAFDQLALIAYTSGSTGVPKGVAVPQRQLVNRFAWMWRDFPFEDGEVACQRAAPSFSVSLWEFLGPLLQGTPVVILPDAVVKDGPRLAAALAENRVTRIVLVPSLVRMLLESGADLSRLGALRLWSVCGEVLAPELCRLFFERLPHGRLLHQYGASELNDAAFHEVPRTAPLGERVAIGRPIANTELHVLDRHLEPAPAGVPGELCAAGPGLARGYHGRVSATATAFVPYPSSPLPGERLYRTGDRGRRLEGAGLEYLGRRDQRVKVRGIRVELAGVEAVLRRHPGVRQAAVVATAHAGETQLVAYVAPTPERSATAGGHARYPLPNGMAVVHLNRNETDFLYDELFEGHTYLKHGITFEDGDVIFDVGANIGLFSLFAHTRCRNPKIFAFEPNPPAFEALRLNASLYGLDAELCDYGLATEEGAARFTYYPKFTFMSGLYGDPDQEKANVRSFLRKQGEAPAGAEPDALIEELLADRFEAREIEVRLETLSQVLRRHRVERVDLLKVNVEKAELDVLLGVAPEDWPRIRQVVLQVHNADGRLERVTGLLRTHGFELTTMRDWAVEADQDVHYVYATRGPRESREHLGDAPADALHPSAGAAVSPFLDAGELRRFLRDRLPEAMVPARFVLLETLPSTASGKVDRRRLPEPGRDASGTAYVAPRDADEEALAGILREVLDLERVGVFDSFFDLGGHSLLATRVMARVQRDFAVDLPLPALFEQPTVAGLAAAVRRARERREEADLLEALARVEGLSDDQARAVLEHGAPF